MAESEYRTLDLRREGVTVFLNSHLLSEIELVCDRVAILDKGQLVRLGTVEEMTTVEQHYALTATAIPEGVLAAHAGVITPRATPEPTADLHHYRLACPERTSLNTLLDHLRTHGVEIEAVAPVRQSLEDYFIDVIQG